MMSELSREINAIWTRLFDHRSYVNVELNLILKEFEAKRRDFDIETLFSILERLTEAKDIHVNQITRASTILLPILYEKLEEAKQIAAEVENSCDNLEKAYEQRTLENREERQMEWDSFVDDMNCTCQRIDNTFEEKEEELRDLYTDLNHKLNINTNTQ